MTSAEASPKTARTSALVVGLVLLAITAWNVYKGREWVSWTTGGAGMLLLVIAACSARASLFFHKYWMRFAAALGAINARVLLSVMYYVVMTPLGLVGRLVGRDPLQRRGQAADSYWIRRERTRQTREQYERTF